MAVAWGAWVGAGAVGVAGNGVPGKVQPTSEISSSPARVNRQAFVNLNPMSFINSPAIRSNYSALERMSVRSVQGTLSLSW
jgi:hypothetical protein